MRRDRRNELVVSLLPKLARGLGTTELAPQKRQRMGQIIFVTRFEFCLPLARLLFGHLGNPETVRDGKASSWQLPPYNISRNHPGSLLQRPPCQSLTPTVHDLSLTEIR